MDVNGRRSRHSTVVTSTSSGRSWWGAGASDRRPCYRLAQQRRARRARDRAVRARPRARRLAGPLPDHPLGPAPVRNTRPSPRRLRGLRRGRSASRACRLVTRDRRPGHRGRRQGAIRDGRHPQRRADTSPLSRSTASTTSSSIADELMARWPQFRLGGSEQRDLSVGVRPRRRPRVQRRARRAGPRARREHPRERPRAGGAPDGDGVEVVTDAETYLADRVVVTSDAWTNEVLRGDGSTDTADRHPGAGDLLRHAVPARVLAGALPGLHVARRATTSTASPSTARSRRSLASTWAGTRSLPETSTFEPDPARLERYARVSRASISRGFLGPELYTRTCLYTDAARPELRARHLPEHPQISVAIGAGHAFKFAAPDRPDPRRPGARRSRRPLPDRPRSRLTRPGADRPVVPARPSMSDHDRRCRPARRAGRCSPTRAPTATPGCRSSWRPP